MEFIDTIEIKNFKSIRHQKIEGCKRVNVFVGYPNVGKSNILEALSIFSLDSNTIFSSLIRLENSTTLFFNGNINDPIEILINNQHKYSGFYYGDTFLKFIYQVSVDAKGFSEINRVNNFSSEDAVKTFEVRDNKHVRDITLNRSTQGLGMGDVRRYIFSDRHAYVGNGFDKLTQPYGDNIFEIISTNEIIRKEVSELFKQYDLRFSFDKSARQFKILKNVGDDIFLISYSMISDTLQRLILFKVAILSSKNTVLLFEEPEAHMFPPYISKFTSDVMYDDNHNQFFVATHSPFVLNDFMENLKDDLSIYAVDYKKETGETLVRRLTDGEIKEMYQFGTDIFLNLENYLENERQ